MLVFFIKEEKIQRTSEINSEISLKNSRNYKGKMFIKKNMYNLTTVKSVRKNLANEICR